MPGRRAKRRVKSPRARAAVRVLVSAVVLGLLILAVGIVAGIVRSAPVTPTPGPGSTVGAGAADYQAGLSALASGDTTKAAGLLSKAAAAGNTAAAAKLAEISKSPSSTSSAVTPEIYTKAAPDLGAFLPTSVPGYRRAEAETSTASAIVSAEPSDRTVRLTVQRVELSVLDKGTASAASAWVAGLSKAFPEQMSDVVVGDVTGRFGTDGSRLAAVVFSRGRFAFEVVVTVVRGEPATQEAVAIKLAETFAAAHNSK